ncbi:MAG TPA: SDR family NAD(P)-dependent oxidoreductase [Nannocystis exedens]|nr:SDR family NAD(P)-dependent oxidoreductase [Nannocystis exedens]
MLLTATIMIVLVTGCRSGFGLLIAVAAARAGHQVYAGLRDLMTRERLEAAAAGLPVTPIQLDVTAPQERQAALTRILAKHGRIDALINNAGIALGGFIEQLGDDELRKVFEVNVFGALALMQLCLPTFRGQRSGVIINISSMSGRAGLPGLGGYAASKFALEGMTEALRHEMRPFGVRVALVEPGPYKTDIFGRNRRVAAKSESPGDYAKMGAKMESIFSEVKMGDPREVADLVVNILGDPRPRLRYPLGPKVRGRLWMNRILSFELQEKIIARVLGF